MRRERLDLCLLVEARDHGVGALERIFDPGEGLDEPGAALEEPRQLVGAQLPR